MGRLELRYDPRFRHFLAPCYLALPERLGGPPAPFARWVFVSLIVDTGAFRSTVSMATAAALGAKVRGLPRLTVAGATGEASLPTLPWLLMQLGGPIPAAVRLYDVPVLGEAERSARAPPGLNLLGMDVLEALGAHLQVDLRRKAGRIGWS